MWHFDTLNYSKDDKSQRKLGWAAVSADGYEAWWYSQPSVEEAVDTSFYRLYYLRWNFVPDHHINLYSTLYWYVQIVFAVKTIFIGHHELLEKLVFDIILVSIVSERTVELLP